MRRLLLIAAAALCVAPSVAAGHGVQGRAQTPIPIAAFSWAAGAVLVLSFAGLAAGWSRPRLTRVPWRAAPRWLDALVHGRLPLAIGRAAVLVTTVGVWSAAAFGSQRLGSNIAPVLVFVVWWIGLVPLSLLFGDVWRALNPWASLARLLRFGSTADRPVPVGMGLWPAALLLVVWGWLELVYPAPGDVRLIGGCIFAYTVITLAGMWRYGIEPWLDRGEVFAVYTRLLATLSVWETRGGRLGVRPPLVGVTRLAEQPAQVAFVAAVIAIITFDGLSGSALWARRDVAAAERLIDRGVDPLWAGIAVATVGMLVTIAIVAGAYEGAARASGRLGQLRVQTRAASTFAYTLVPIAVAYAVAHYFTLFVFQAQDLARLVSDPYGFGWDLFGTAAWQIDFQAVSANAIWAVQVTAIVVGHVASLALAHDRALAVAPRHRLALASQVPLLLLMVALTVAGLWSLSQGMATA